MTTDAVRKIAESVLYEGYILYPYRADALKNRRRFDFGVLVPRDIGRAGDSGDAWTTRTECLVEGAAPVIDVCVRFLHLGTREIASQQTTWQETAWQEAIEREVLVSQVRLPELVGNSCTTSFTFATQQDATLRQQTVRGEIALSAEPLGPSLWRLTADTTNVTPSSVGDMPRDEVLLAAFVSTHTVLTARVGEFVSSIDPPAELASAVAACRNVGAWPVLVGTEPARRMMLSAPVILYDYPYVAPESAGDFCDGTEMDEMLALRVMTLTDDEKARMRFVDRRAREILERTESLTPAGMAALHGTIRGWRTTVAAAEAAENPGQ